MPGSAALFGDVVHVALETIVKALVASGCESAASAEAVRVLRGLGGITAIAERVLEQRLGRHDGNPRLDEDRLRRLRVELAYRLPDARARIQAYLSRMALPMAPKRRPGQASNADAADERQRGARQPIAAGAHAETELTAKGLRLTGHVDLLTVDDDAVRITDYKTGTEDASHVEQLRVYALLWDLDREANPDRRAATELTVAYSSHEVTIPAPVDDELRTLERSLQARIAAAEAEVASELPRAKPSNENCRSCYVRQLCGEYWEQMVQNPDAVSPGAWFDYEGVVAGQNGARSWSMVNPQTRRPELLLRTVSASTHFTMGDGIRVLGLRRDEDPDSDLPVGAMSATSEIFVLTDRGS